MFQKIKIPEDVEVKLEDKILIVKGKEGENRRKLNFGKLKFEIKDGIIKIWHLKATKKEKKQINTLHSHIKNMIKGVQEKFEYKLKICFVHFPFTVKQNGKEIIIKNFLGEKIERKTEIPDDVEFNIDKETITIKSTDKEKAGQAAANLERATKIRGRDIRIFQDGIYLINKNGREI